MHRSFFNPVMCAFSAMAVISLTGLVTDNVAVAAEPVKLIVPYPPGGNADNLARLFADRLSKELDRPVVVENKGGASGAIGAQAVARAKPDGNTLMLAPTGVVTITPFLRKVNYDPILDFEPIAKLTASVGLVAARKDFPGSTLQDLVKYEKAHQGKLTYGSAGLGTLTHLQALLLANQLGIKALHVPYKGSGEAMNDVLAGRIDFQYDSVVLPAVMDGRLKALAVVDRMNIPALKDVKTIAEQGVQLKTSNWYGLFAPKGTPSKLIEAYAAASRKVITAPQMAEHLFQFAQLPAFEDHQKFKQSSARDVALYKEIIADNHITIN